MQNSQSMNMGGMMDPNNIVNMMMGTQMMGMMSSLNKGADFSIDKIFIFILLICMTEIKKYLLEALDYAKKNAPEFFLEFGRAILKKRNLEDESTNPLQKESEHKMIAMDSSAIIHLKPNIFVINALHVYMAKLSASNKKHKIKNEFRIDIESFDKKNTTIEYTDIIIPINEYTQVTLLNKLKVTYDNENSVVKYQIEDKNGLSCNEMNLIDYTGCYFFTALDESFPKDFIHETLKKLTYKDLKKIDTSIFQFIESIQNDTFRSSHRKIVITQYAKEYLFPYFFLLTYYETEIVNNNSIQYNDILINFIILCAIEIKLKADGSTGPSLRCINGENNLYRITYSNNSKVVFPSLKFLNFPISKLFSDISGFSIYLKKTSIQMYFTNVSKSDNSDTMELTFKIVADTPLLPEKELYDSFISFYETNILPCVIKKKSTVTNEKITVFTIEIKTTEKIVEEPNPEYEEWTELLKLKDSSSEEGNDKSPPAKKEGGEIPSHFMMEMIKIKPPKTVIKKTATSSVECTVVNKMFKDVKTLYLREMDKMNLVRIVDMFKNNRELYEQLGIRHKLGMMFHGRPGTGKTTSIIAIASYLGKDIYFINLKNVRTNSDLKKIFDHINEKCDGGIIVFEDIDAMTKIVHRRDVVDDVDDIGTETSLANSMEECNDDITLSYLLNLLDGGLCKDGTIFAITTNHLEKLDTALYRDGRVDICIEFKRCDHYQIQEIFKSILKRELSKDILEQICENVYTPVQIIFHLLKFMFDTFTDDIIMEKFMEKKAVKIDFETMMKETVF